MKSFHLNRVRVQGQARFGEAGNTLGHHHGILAPRIALRILISSGCVSHAMVTVKRYTKHHHSTLIITMSRCHTLALDVGPPRLIYDSGPINEPGACLCVCVCVMTHCPVYFHYMFGLVRQGWHLKTVFFVIKTSLKLCIMPSLQTVHNTGNEEEIPSKETFLRRVLRSDN